jgi:hypothetical protein
LNQRRKHREGIAVSAAPRLKQASQIGRSRHVRSLPAPVGWREWAFRGATRLH